MSYYVEIADGGPWLALDGTVTAEWLERGLWDSYEEAAEAVRRSLHGRPADEDPKINRW